MDPFTTLLTIIPPTVMAAAAYRKAGRIHKDVGFQNGNGPVTTMLESLIKRMDRMEEKFDRWQDGR